MADQSLKSFTVSIQLHNVPAGWEKIPAQGYGRKRPKTNRNKR